MGGGGKSSSGHGSNLGGASGALTHRVQKASATVKYKPFDQGVNRPATMNLVALSTHGGGAGAGGGAGSSVPGQSQNLQSRTLPSDILRSLKSPANPVADGQPRQPPQIIEFLNMRDYTTQVDSIVDIGEPIFQPFPPKIIFHGYEAHSELVARLSLRNNDSVSRRVKILRPQSPFVTVEPEITSSGQKKSGNKVAPGMETHFRVTFRPSSDLSFEYNLIVATERGKVHRAHRCHRVRTRARSAGPTRVPAGLGQVHR